MIAGEQKLARGATDALLPRGTLAYVVCSITVTAYALTTRVRHLMVTAVTSYGLAITLPPVAEAAGQIYSVVLDAYVDTAVTIDDAGDDADMTQVTLNAADECWVGLSNGVRWIPLVSVNAVL